MWSASVASWDPILAHLNCPADAVAASLSHWRQQSAEVALEADTEWERLLVAANSGDGRAMGRFLTAATPAIRTIVRARGHALPLDQHEDIVQEVLIAIHAKRHTWKAGTPVRPWVFAITRYKVADAFRRRGTHIHLPIEEFADVLAHEQTEEPDAQGEAARLLAQIDMRSADIVRAVTLDGESAESVGTRLGVSGGAVRVALHRAMKKLSALTRRIDE
jgi:RNA polymerase sigma-70 factor (ECF subfamily)